MSTVLDKQNYDDEDEEEGRMRMTRMRMRRVIGKSRTMKRGAAEGPWINIEI